MSAKRTTTKKPDPKKRKAAAKPAPAPWPEITYEDARAADEKLRFLRGDAMDDEWERQARKPANPGASRAALEMVSRSLPRPGSNGSGSA